MTLFRGYGGDLPLMRWLREKIWPVEAKLEAEDVYWGTRLACVEMIRTGHDPLLGHVLARRRRPRGRSPTPACGRRSAAPLFDARRRHRRRCRRSALDEPRARWRGVRPPRSHAGLAPHAIYTVSEESLRWIAELAAERGLPVQIHLSETEQEVDDCLAAHGVRPAAYLDRLGLLGERTVLAHGVWLDRDELELIAERGATVVTNPVANMKLAVGGVFPYPAARAAGVGVGLGTDGAGSNDSLDLLADLKIFALPRSTPPATRPRSPPPRRWRSPPAPLARCSARNGARGRRAGRLPAAPRLGPGALGRRLGCRPRLRGQRLGRRHHRRRRPGADAGRRGDGAEEIVAEVRSRARRLTG